MTVTFPLNVYSDSFTHFYGSVAGWSYTRAHGRTTMQAFELSVFRAWAHSDAGVKFTRYYTFMKGLVA